MKKVLLSAVAICCVLAFASCGSKKEDKKDATEQAPTTPVGKITKLCNDAAAELEKADAQKAAAIYQETMEKVQEIGMSAGENYEPSEADQKAMMEAMGKFEEAYSKALRNNTGGNQGGNYGSSSSSSSSSRDVMRSAYEAAEEEYSKAYEAAESQMRSAYEAAEAQMSSAMEAAGYDY